MVSTFLITPAPLHRIYGLPRPELGSLLEWNPCCRLQQALMWLFGRKLGNACFWQKNDSQSCAQWPCLNYGFTKVGKALQDHGIQPLTQHCPVHPCPQVPLLTFFECHPEWWLHYLPGQSLALLYNLPLKICLLICDLSIPGWNLRPFPLVLHPGKAERSPILFWQQHLFFLAGLNLAFELEWEHCSAPCSGVICAAAQPDKRCRHLPVDNGLLHYVLVPVAAKKMLEQWESSPALWQQCSVSLRFIGNDKP